MNSLSFVMRHSNLKVITQKSICISTCAVVFKHVLFAVVQMKLVHLINYYAEYLLGTLEISLTDAYCRDTAIVMNLYQRSTLSTLVY